MNIANLISGHKYRDEKKNYNNLIYGEAFEKLDYKCDCCGKNLHTNNCYEFATFKDENVIANLINADGSINHELWCTASGYYHYGSECIRKHIIEADV